MGLATVALVLPALELLASLVAVASFVVDAVPDAKQLDLQRRNFDVVVKDLSHTSKHQANSTDVVIGNQVAMIRHLQTMVASAELSVEFIRRQLETEHKDAMSDLMVATRSKILDLKYDHVTYLAEEKK